MLEIAKLRTLAPPKVIVAWEIDQALARRFGRPFEVSPVSIVGFGVGHAFGERLQVPVGRFLDETIDEWAQRKVQAQYIFEVGAITGVRGDGPMENLAAHNEISARYAQGEHNLASRMHAAGITGTARDDVLLIDEIADISKVLDERMRAARVTWSEFTALGRDGIASFLDDLPSRAVTLALRRERHRNPNERWKGGDLHDIAALSLAVGYCDIVVMEKHMHALLLRSGIAERFGTTLLRRASNLVDVLDRMFKGASRFTRLHDAHGVLRPARLPATTLGGISQARGAPSSLVARARRRAGALPEAWLPPRRLADKSVSTAHLRLDICLSILTSMLNAVVLRKTSKRGGCKDHACIPPDLGSATTPQPGDHHADDLVRCRWSCSKSPPLRVATHQHAIVWRPLDDKVTAIALPPAAQYTRSPMFGPPAIRLSATNAIPSSPSASRSPMGSGIRWLALALAVTGGSPTTFSHRTAF